MSWCALRCCKSRGSLDKKELTGITFHKFPKDPDRRKLWIDFVNRPNWEPSKNAKLCSNHFLEEYFDRTSLSVVRLRLNAVPTLNTKQVTSKRDHSPLVTSYNGLNIDAQQKVGGGSNGYLMMQYFTIEPLSATMDSLGSNLIGNATIEEADSLTFKSTQPPVGNTTPCDDTSSAIVLQNISTRLTEDSVTNLRNDTSEAIVPEYSEISKLNDEHSYGKMPFTPEEGKLTNKLRNCLKVSAERKKKLILLQKKLVRQEKKITALKGIISEVRRRNYIQNKCLGIIFK